METVVVDELSNSSTSAPNIIIDVDDENSNDVIEVIDILPIPNDDQRSQIEEITNENSALGELIEKCISLDTSGAMIRVINRTLIPLYINHARKFSNIIQKQVFEKALKKALTQIEMDPMYKYSHIKEFCEALKTLKDKKKKVPFVTLSKNVKDTPIKNTYNSEKRRKRPRLDIAAVINIDDDEIEVPLVNPNKNISDVTVLESIQGKEKENTRSNGNASVRGPWRFETVQQHFIEIDIANEVVFDPDSNSLCYKDKSYSIADGSGQNSVLGYSVLDSIQIQNQKEKSPEELARQIKSIEAEIATYQKFVEDMGVKEVTEDNMMSPYLQSEYYKSRIVKLYKKLCELTGRPSVKRREIRLRAIDSRSELPLKKLEQLINDNIGSDGQPHFPDFEEVVYCVRQANIEGCLGWQTAQILNEARALFGHCGRAIQRNRQRREWRDMQRLLRSELRDPADEDPELQAQLELNRLVARLKETEILEKYASMESKSRVSIEVNRNEENKDWDENQIKIVQVVSYNQTDLGAATNNDNCRMELNKEKDCNTLNNNVQLATDSLAHKDFTNHNNESSNEQLLNSQFVSMEVPQSFVNSVIAANSALVLDNETLTHIRDSKTSQIYVCQTALCSKTSDAHYPMNSEIDSNALNINFQSSNNSVVNKGLTNDNGESSSKQTSNLHLVRKVASKQVSVNSMTTDVANIASQCIETLTQVGTNKSHIEILSIEIDNSPDEYSETNNNDKEIFSSEKKSDIYSPTINTSSEGFSENKSSCTEINDTSKILQEKLVDNYVSCQNNGFSESLVDNTKVNDVDKDNMLAENVISNVKTEVNDTTKESENLDNTLNNTKGNGLKTNTENLIANVKAEATIKELEDFGNDFTMTILGIEDPFLVIEISSDSSSEDEDTEDLESDDDVAQVPLDEDQLSNNT